MEVSTTAEVQAAIEAATAPLREHIALLLDMCDTHLSTAEAMRLLGVSRPYLEKERNRPGTLLRVVFQGKKPTYSRVSVLELKKARSLAPTYDPTK